MDKLASLIPLEPFSHLLSRKPAPWVSSHAFECGLQGPSREDAFLFHRVEQPQEPVTLRRLSCSQGTERAIAREQDRVEVLGQREREGATSESPRVD